MCCKIKKTKTIEIFDNYNAKILPRQGFWRTGYLMQRTPYEKKFKGLDKRYKHFVLRAELRKFANNVNI